MFDITYDIDDLIEPKNKKKNIFAKTVKEIKEGYRDYYPYEVLGQSYPEGIEMGQDWQRLGKGREAHIEFMTPDEYLNSVGPMADKVNNERSRAQIEKYKKSAMAGNKFPLPYLDYREGTFSGQEGIHRAVMAKELKIEKIPVVKTDTDIGRYKDPNWYLKEQEYYNKKKKQNPFTFEEELI